MDTNIQSYTYCFIDDIINIKNFDPNSIKEDIKKIKKI